MAGGVGTSSATKLHHRVIDDLDQATIGLALIDDDPVGAVHSARRRIKRARATIELLRSIDPAGLDTEDEVLRRAATLLGPIRDRHVAQHLAEKMGRWPGDLIPPPLAPSLRVVVSQSSVLLLGVRSRANGWNPSSVSDTTIRRQLDRRYRRTRARWQAAAEHLDRDDLHRCRRAVKRTTNQLEVAVPSAVTDARFVELVELGELLGDHHDLGLVPDPDRHDEADLELRIVELGSRLFAMKPGRHRRWIDDLVHQ